MRLGAWRERGAAVALSAAIMAGLGGCSVAPSAESLKQPLTTASSAAHSTALALTLMIDGRTTHAAAETVVGDMVREAESALKDVRALEARTPEQAGQRDAAAAAVDRLAGALAHVRDGLAHDGAASPAANLLAEVRAAEAGIQDAAGGIGADVP